MDWLKSTQYAHCFNNFVSDIFMFSKKFSLTPNVNPRCFWDTLFFKGISLNERQGWRTFLVFLLNITSLRLLSQIRIKNQNSTFSQDEFCPFRAIHFLMQYRKSPNIFNRFPEIPFKMNFRSNASYHTLSKACDISKKTPLTSSPSSNDLYILWVIVINSLTQESPVINPDWLGGIKLLSVKKVKSSL